LGQPLDNSLACPLLLCGSPQVTEKKAQGSRPSATRQHLERHAPASRAPGQARPSARKAPGQARPSASPSQAKRQPKPGQARGKRQPKPGQATAPRSPSARPPPATARPGVCLDHSQAMPRPGPASARSKSAARLKVCSWSRRGRYTVRGLSLGGVCGLRPRAYYVARWSL